MDNTFDRMFYPEGELIGGIDETGVSDIAGPLVAACVILPKIDIHKDDLKIFEIRDSKKVPERFRKQHAEVIWQTAIAIGIGEVQPAEVDYLGREGGVRLAMLRSVAACKTVSRNKQLRPDFLLVDGHVPLHCGIKQKLLREGDNKSLCIAAASIVAKVYRDEIMVALHRRYPYYDWISNKGFPCEQHFQGLDQHGIQIGIHRIRYWPFRLNTSTKGEELVQWETRRRLWRKVTEDKLGVELGDNLWTTDPPLHTPLPSSKKPSRKEARTTSTSSASSNSSSVNSNSTPSGECTKSSENSSMS